MSDYETPQEINLFEQSKIGHSLLSDFEVSSHLLNVLLPSVLWFSFEIYEGGLIFGLLATILAGVVWSHCIHTLVKCSHVLNRRNNNQLWNIGDIAAAAWSSGPRSLHKLSWFARFVVNGTHITYLLFSCIAHIIFVSTSVKNSIEHFSRNYDDDNENSTMLGRIYYLAALIPLILISIIKKPKYLLPFSLIGNISMMTGFGIVAFFDFLCFKMSYPLILEFNLPKLFGNMLLAFEGIDVVMSLENKMKNPSHLLGFRSIMGVCTAIVVHLSAIIGVYGYFDVPLVKFERLDQNVYQAGKLCLAITGVSTFAIRYFVLMEILWGSMKRFCPKSFKNLAEYTFRISIVILMTAISIFFVKWLLPSAIFIMWITSFVLTFITPMLVEIATYYQEYSRNDFVYILFKNFAIIVICLVAGVYRIDIMTKFYSKLVVK